MTAIISATPAPAGEATSAVMIATRSGWSDMDEPRGWTDSVMVVAPELTIGVLGERAGVATSALRFYESEGLIHTTRSSAGQRRFARDTRRRVSFIRSALASLPENRTPNERDWERLSKRRLSRRKRTLLLLNPGDRAGERGPGPRYVLDD